MTIRCPSTGRWKVAVDYQENIAAGLQILETTWNQLYSAGIIANNGDPRYLENWYFAAWAYNSGIQPNAANVQHHRLHARPVVHRPGRHLGAGLDQQPGRTWTTRPTATRTCRTPTPTRRTRRAGRTRSACWAGWPAR